MSRRALGAALLAACAAACDPPVDGAPCGSAADCPQGQLCTPTGRCEPPGRSGGPQGTPGGGASSSSGAAGTTPVGGSGTTGPASSGGSSGGGSSGADGGALCTGLPDGTACAPGLACLGGSCVCEAGASCSLGPDPCTFGTSSCQGGALACVGSQIAADGTACGVGRVCASGACTACQAGAPCSAGPCQSGQISCDSGRPICLNPGHVPDGTPCGNGAVCQGGNCAACAQGQSCTASGNPCLTGTFDCSTGTAVCGSTSPLPDGTPCAGGACASGSCAACQAGASCSPVGQPCLVGRLDCTRGAVCQGPFANRTDGSSCGPGQTCQAGACSCENRCSSVGQSCAGADSVSSCTIDARGCYEESTTPCPAGSACSGGQCVCQDQCQAGESRCADGGAVSCTLEPTGCYGWASPAPCPGTSSCAAGAGAGACACPAPAPGEWTVARSAGSDALGNGSAACPFSTITHALELAAAGPTPSQVYVLAGGTPYSAAGGESFPLVVPPGTSLVGLGAPVVEGLGAVGSGTGVDAAIVAFGDVSGLHLAPGSVQPGTVGVYCNAFSPRLDGDEIHGFEVGVEVDGSCRALISACDIHDNGAATGAGVAVVGSGAPSVQGSRLHGNATGLSVVSGATAPTLLANDEIDGSLGDGVDCAAASALALRLCFVHANQGIGVSLSDSCAADLSGIGPSGGCGEASTFTCNAQGDLATSSSVAVQADHDNWDSEPPGSKDVQTASGSSAAVTPTCSQVAGSPDPQPQPTGCP